MLISRMYRNGGRRPALRMARRWIVAGLSALALVACSDDATSPARSVKTLEVTPAEPQLMVGDTVRLAGLAKAADGGIVPGVTVEWVVDDTTVATIVQQGGSVWVTAKKAGTVTVTGKVSASGQPLTAQARVYVNNPLPVPGAVQPASLPVQTPGAQVTITGSGFLPVSKASWNGEERPTTYVSATTVKVELSVADLATARINQIRVTNPAPGGGASVPLPFEVSVAPVARIDLDPAAATVQAGGTIWINATPRDAAGNPLFGRVVTWISGGPGVASVDPLGEVRALSPGIALITAESEGQRSSAVIMVPALQQGAPVITSMSPESIGVPVHGQGVDVTVTGTSFRPGMTIFANSTGRSTAMVNATTLTATLSWDDVSQPRTLSIRVYDPATQQWSNSMAIVVYPDLEHLVVTPGQSWIFPSQTQKLTAVGKDAAGNSYHHAVTWVSETPAVATVDADGTVRPVTTGQAIIRATMKGRTTFGIVQTIVPPTHDVLYESDRSGKPELYLLTPGANQAPRRLLAAGTYGSDPAVSPDGNRIAFVGRDAQNNADIYVVRRDGSNLVRLTNAAGDDDQPTWSPDGQTIAFRSSRSGYRDIWTMDASGGNQRNLMGGGFRIGAPTASRPTWSADGSRIAFSLGDLTVQPFRPTILSMDPNGQDVRLLVGTGQGDYDPAFSPDGEYLAIRTNLFGASDRLSVRRPDGNALAWLNEPGHGLTPAWSPDGRWLAFVSGDDTSVPGDVFLGQPGSAMRIRLTAGAATGGGSKPTWIRR